jgi:UDP-N-acetylmuramate dehydrogenase
MSLHFQKNRFLSEFSTFGIGGPVLYFAEILSSEEMARAFEFCRKEKLPLFILGKGSNCLFDDRGFSGLVLQNKIDFCNWNEKSVDVGAGYSFSLLGSQSARKGLTGLEFASGIPATVGGAITMNAGANGKETIDSLHSISYLHLDGTFTTYPAKDLQFSYRFSSFQKMKGAILSASFHLEPLLEAREKQLKIIDYRMKTQPLKDKSAGCIFRNPSKELSAGALIEKFGLKGFSIGGAKVSEIHANFIVNQDKATSQDVVELIQKIQKLVYEKTNIHLETEVKIISHVI